MGWDGMMALLDSNKSINPRSENSRQITHISKDLKGKIVLGSTEKNSSKTTTTTITQKISSNSFFLFSIPMTDQIKRNKLIIANT